MTSTTLPSGTGIVTSYSYDDADRLTDIEHVKNGSTTVASVAYTLDDVGNRTQRVDQQGTHTYAYDDLYRLTSVTYPGPSTTTYAFDAFGNREEMTSSAGTTTYTYDDADRITQVQPPSPAAAIPYDWDDNGNQVERGSDEFVWDYEDRMVEATVNSVVTTFAYRGDGLRNSRTVGMTTTTFTWDINAGLPVVLDDGPAAEPEGYVYGAGLTSMKQGGNWYYYLADGLGSTMAIVDASGDVENGYTYDVYGEPTVTGSLGNEFDFAGQQTDPNTGLQYLRARYYDPVSGTFMSREPLAVGQYCTLHPFGYSQSQPTRFVDPTGLIQVDSGPGGGGRSDCEGLWATIVASVEYIYSRAKAWYENDYGKWDKGYGAAPGAQMTPESRAAHYAAFDDRQRGLQRQLDDYFARGSSKQRKPCPPPGGGGAWNSAKAALVLLTAEYFKGKSLDDAAKHWDRAQGGTGWSWRWPQPPDLGNSPQ